VVFIGIWREAVPTESNFAIGNRSTKKCAANVLVILLCCFNWMVQDFGSGERGNFAAIKQDGSMC
jgi:hypothetical protein